MLRSERLVLLRWAPQSLQVDTISRLLTADTIRRIDRFNMEPPRNSSRNSSQPPMRLLREDRGHTDSLRRTKDEATAFQRRHLGVDVEALSVCDDDCCPIEDGRI